jgi:AcrR family transcriptional regulator
LVTTSVEARALRADAQRNRDALLIAAIEAFAQNGTETSLEDIARRAGVGIGTLYRHFPTREALVVEAYRRGVDTVCEDAARLLSEEPPDAALLDWMTAFVDYVASKRGLAATLKQASDVGHHELFADMRAKMLTALQSMIDAAIADGAIRSDVDPADLLRTLGGLCMMSDQPEWKEQARRMVALLMDGLRYGAPAAR